VRVMNRNDLGHYWLPRKDSMESASSLICESVTQVIS
jgi:hypothetical protein